MGAGFSTLPQLWRARCAEHGNRPAMRYKQGGIWSTVTWQQFAEDAHAIAMALSAAGVSPGDVVGILADNRPEWLVVEFATLALGGIVCGIEPQSSAADAGLSLHRGAARIVFVDTFEQLAKVRHGCAAGFRSMQMVAFESHGLHGADHERIARYAEWLASGRRLVRERPRRFDELVDQGRHDAVALLAESGGTTVPLTHSALLLRMSAALGWMQLEPGDHVASFEPLAHPDEQVATLTALLQLGALVHFAEGPATVFNDLAEAAPRMVSAPARFWTGLHDRVQQAMNDAPPQARRAYAGAVAAAHPTWWRRALLRRMSRSLGLQQVRMGIVASGVVEPPVATWYRALGVPLRLRRAS